MNTIEVCLTPKLFDEIITKGNYIVVMVDILRASTSICAAFANDVKAIIPVASLDEAREYKKKGYLVASERDGKVLDFADFGNSAFNFMTKEVVGATIVYSTTNGTQAIDLAKHSKGLAIGAFTNLSALTTYLIHQNSNIIILCSGWKNKFNLEDTIFAGALIERLILDPHFKMDCDAAEASLDLWKLAKDNPLAYIEKAAHRHRLKKLNLDDVMEYTFINDSTHVVPILKDNILVDALK